MQLNKTSQQYVESLQRNWTKRQLIASCSFPHFPNNSTNIVYLTLPINKITHLTYITPLSRYSTDQPKNLLFLLSQKSCKNACTVVFLVAIC